MTTQLNTQTYSQINTEVTNLLKTGQYSGVNITIYVDAEGNVPATLNGNAVENRKIMKINSTASYKNKQGQTVKPCVDVHFTGNEIFKSVDEDDTYYYKLAGVAVVKRFG
jgi:hypothetical protein|tara:strand:+ start:699 stop:1028 length:330 start_codon:yes stop_codon:yes gene_type:complete